MSSSWRAVRARILTPDRAETRLEVRGFHVKDETGGTDEAEQAVLRHLAGSCRPRLAQGAALVAAARLTADLSTADTEAALRH